MTQQRILIIDDDDALARTYSKALGIFGGFPAENIVTMASSEQALQALLTGENPKTFDLIITDVDMVKGQSDGIEMLAQLRQQGMSTLVIVNSGNSAHGGRLTQQEHGDYVFLAKPLSVRDLAGKAKELLSRDKGPASGFAR